jgi:hypothetical protein
VYHPPACERFRRRRTVLMRNPEDRLPTSAGRSARCSAQRHRSNTVGQADMLRPRERGEGRLIAGFGSIHLGFTLRPFACETGSSSPTVRA